MTLKRARIAAGYTSTEAARLLQVTQQTLSRIENGHTHRISFVLAVRMAKVYGCPLETLARISVPGEMGVRA